jgi:two-component system OmpR family response regulator
VVARATEGANSGRALVSRLSRSAIAGDSADAMLVAPTSQRARAVQTGAHSSRRVQIFTSAPYDRSAEDLLKGGPRPPPYSGERTGVDMHVLVVEDEPHLAESIRQGLAVEGFNVHVVDDGVEGLWSATENTYDAIVLDIMLPKLNGYDVLKQLRAREVWTPVLMLTAKDGELDQADAFDLGADDYLTKPFSYLLLVSRLRALIRRGAPARPVVLTAGDLELDPSRRRVARGDDEIHLTPREFAVLEYLMRHAGDAVSKAEILQNVWDANYEGDLNVVEVYVRYLRRKIDVPYGRQTIETVRGRGYRIAPEGG